MNNQFLNTQRAKFLLNRSVADLAPSTLAQLRSAREQALAHRRVAASAPVFAGLNGNWHESFQQHKQMYFAATLLLIACLFSGAAYWQHGNDHDNTEVDIAILTDELPVDVYVD